MATSGSTRNKTITLSDNEIDIYSRRLLTPDGPVDRKQIQDRTICQDAFQCLRWLPEASVDLLIADPPYNLTKAFNTHTFNKRSGADYSDWLESWIKELVRVLKPEASMYICGDWRSSPSIHDVCSRYFKIHNRITWEREKGRGSKKNWKNNSEDIWYCTMSNDFTFNVDAVKLKRRVIAPYRDAAGKPKDWETQNSVNTRLTHPSNIWTDLTVPFWSMPENTEHPTQKPEKLVARLILASSNPGDMVLDPFLGSGTTSVVAKKLGRRFVGIEMDRRYCCLAEKRLEMAAANSRIQGYYDGVFWERNSGDQQARHATASAAAEPPSTPESPSPPPAGRRRQQELFS